MAEKKNKLLRKERGKEYTKGKQAVLIELFGTKQSRSQGLLELNIPDAKG